MHTFLILWNSYAFYRTNGLTVTTVSTHPHRSIEGTNAKSEAYTIERKCSEKKEELTVTINNKV